MADWYVFQHDAPALGPWSTEVIAEAILTGKLAPDVWVAVPGGDRWVRALDVPVIAQRIEGVSTRRPRRDSGLRVMPGVYQQNPHMASTVMMVKDDEADLVPSEFEGEEDAPPTEPSLPPPAPSSPTPPPTVVKRAQGC